MGIATQLITVAATLAGVVLTLFANGYFEHRRARDVRALEVLRLTSEHVKWLRDERLKSYAGFSLAAEEALQFLRSELSPLIGSAPERRVEAEARWHALSTELRKAYNLLLLFGTDDTRDAGRQVWRIAWYGGNDFLRDLSTDPGGTGHQGDLSEHANDVVARLGVAGNSFLDFCRKDLQQNDSAGRPDA